MADASEDMRADLEKQIAELKKEMVKMGKMLSSKAIDAHEDAQEVWEGGKGRAREAAAQVRDQAQAAVGAMRKNPGTTATVLSAVGLLGLVAGFMLCSLCPASEKR